MTNYKQGDLVEIALPDDEKHRFLTGGIGFFMKFVRKADADPQKVWMPASQHGDLADILIGTSIERHELRRIMMLNPLTKKVNP